MSPRPPFLLSLYSVENTPRDTVPKDYVAASEAIKERADVTAAELEAVKINHGAFLPPAHTQTCHLSSRSLLSSSPAPQAFYGCSFVLDHRTVHR